MELFTKNVISDEGRISVKKQVDATTYPVHKHEFIELVYVVDGSGSQTVDDQEYQVSHGSLLFIDYGQTHSIITDAPMTYVNILLEPEFFSKELVNVESIIEIFCYNLFSEFSGRNDSALQCVRFQNEELVQVDNLIEIMLKEYEQKQLGYLSALRAGTQMLFSWLLRKMNSNTEAVIHDSVQDVLEYINKHFAEKLELSDIAARGFYNPDYLSKLLKKYCGKSFSQYVKEKRIHQAAKLIMTTGLSVNEIMIQSGYTDSKIFYKHFKEIYGEAPGVYRKRKIQAE